MLRKVILVGLVGAMLAGLVVVAQEPVTVEFWHRFGPDNEVSLNILKGWFEARYPHITIEYVYQGSYGALQQKINGAVVAGEVPTMAIFYEDWIPPVANSLLPLGPFFTEEETADIIPGLLYKDMLTIPFNKSIMVLIYIEEYVPDPPTTWQEFYDVAMANTVDEDGDGVIDRYGTGFRPGNPEQFFCLLAQNNGTILNEDWTAVTLGNDAGVEALNYYASVVPYAWVTSAYLNTEIGRAAMAIDTSAGFKHWASAAEGTGLTVKAAPLPVGKTAGSFIQGTNIGIFKDAPQEEIDAGILFLKFLLEADNTGFWAAMSGYMPVTSSGLDSEVWIYKENSADEVAASTTMMPVGIASLAHPNYGDMREAMMTYFEEVLLGASTVAEILPDLVAELEALLDY